MIKEKVAPIPPLFAVKVAQAMQDRLSHISQKMAPPFVHVLDMAAGTMKSQLINMAAKLELADRLKEKEKSIEELAAELECNEDALYRLMRALSAFEIFKETSFKTFATTTYGKTLEKDQPMSLHPLALLVAEPMWKEPWNDLLYSIKTGEGSFDHVFGKSYFEYLSENEEKWELFNSWMDSISNMNCPIIAGSFPFDKFKKVVDIGGGYGAQIAHILKRYENVRGVLFDLPEVVETPKSIDESIADRCEVVGGSFLDEVPAGGDLYIMQQIIHDWNDDIAIQILSNCCNAMDDNGRVLVVDAVIEPGNKFDMNKVIDLQMLAITNGGRERTKEQFQSLFDKSGLELVKVHPTAAMFSIVEAKKKK